MVLNLAESWAVMKAGLMGMMKVGWMAESWAASLVGWKVGQTAESWAAMTADLTAESLDNSMAATRAGMKAVTMAG